MSIKPDTRLHLRQRPVRSPLHLPPCAATLSLSHQRLLDLRERLSTLHALPVKVGGDLVHQRHNLRRQHTHTHTQTDVDSAARSHPLLPCSLTFTHQRTRRAPPKHRSRTCWCEYSGCVIAQCSSSVSFTWNAAMKLSTSLRLGCRPCGAMCRSSAAVTCIRRPPHTTAIETRPTCHSQPIPPELRGLDAFKRRDG